MPEGIAVLGESLLGRAKETNKRRNKANRREAYKIAFGTGATSLLNKTLARKSDQFLQQEKVLAAKARYKATADQASQIYSIRDAAAEKNQTMEDFFYENKYLPALQQEYAAKFGNKFTTASYAPQMNAEARRLSVAEASEFETAVTAADKVPSLEEASKNIDSLIAPPRNAGEALISKVGGFFSGKSSNDVSQEILQRVDEDGLLKNQAAKGVFDAILADSGASAAADWAGNLDAANFEPNDIVTQTHVLQVVGDNLVMASVDEVKHFDGSTDLVKNGEGNFVTKEVIPVGKLDAARVDDMSHKQRVSTNVSGLADTFLTPDGVAALADLMSTNNLNFTNVYDSQENLNQVSQMFTRLLVDPNNVKDPEKAELMNTTLSAFLDSTGPLFTALSGKLNTDTPLEAGGEVTIAQEAMSDVEALLKEITGAAMNLSEGITEAMSGGSGGSEDFNDIFDIPTTPDNTGSGTVNLNPDPIGFTPPSLLSR